MTGIAITIERGPGVEQSTRLAFGSERVSIGRARSCDVCLPEPTVSAHHADIRREGRDWFVTDVGSANGTRLNGSDLDRGIPKLLRSGDRLRIAGFEIGIEVDVSVNPDTASSTAMLGRGFVREVLSHLHPDQSVPRLQIVAGPDAGRSATLDAIGTEIRIGRAVDLELSLIDALASREHALVRRDLAGLLLVDLGGKNRTLVGGATVSGERRLHDRDEIRIGNTRIAVSDPAESLIEELEQIPDAAWSPEPSAAPMPLEERRPSPPPPTAGKRRATSYEWIIIAVAVCAMGAAGYLIYTLLADSR
jgi:pSer/pThr/pTyr-binding forkhead associated (FHA) protein